MCIRDSFRRSQAQKPLKTRVTEYLRRWFAYKAFRTDVINDINTRRDRDNQPKIEMKFLEHVFFAMLVNSVLLPLWVYRKDPMTLRLLKTSASLSYTYVVMAYFGEERMFYEACMRNDSIGEYLREAFLKEFGLQHEYSETFTALSRRYQRDLRKISVQEMEKTTSEFVNWLERKA
eukprot:TRINITY_DN13835_c0_g1_i3.p1 TRINITY_DN13835_c0_g1~~TRINITY_DN13835_c0_g1_i3.p1  ORF type:complete len:176 (-),score=26.35 TRINITY_DN13835_c0_g1_i3:7-534(-)